MLMQRIQSCGNDTIYPSLAGVSTMKQQLLLPAVCAAFALLAATADAGAEFTPSVVLTTVKEMENNCEQMVDNALTLNSKEIKFVPTVHFFGSETNINSYCFRYGHNSSKKSA